MQGNRKRSATCTATRDAERPRQASSHGGVVCLGRSLERLQGDGGTAVAVVVGVAGGAHFLSGIYCGDSRSPEGQVRISSWTVHALSSVSSKTVTPRRVLMVEAAGVEPASG